MQCPRHLDRGARREWHRISGELYVAGLLTVVDRAMLAAYCQAYSRWFEAERQLAKTSLVIETDKGNLMAHPLVGIANRSMVLMLKFAIEFGMTPSARARVKAEPLKPETSLVELLFSGVSNEQH